MAILSVLVLSAHLLAANLAGAAPLVCIGLDVLWQKRQDDAAGRLGRYLLVQSLIWLTAGILLGGATLAVVWAAHWESFRDAATRLPSARYWWAIPELLFYYACVGGYLWLWRARISWQVLLRRFLGLLAGTNLLYHFPLLFTMIGVYGSREPGGGGPLNFRAAMIDAEVFSQFLHHVLASFAVVGVAAIGYALRLRRTAGLEGDAARIATWGGRIALVPTMLQLLVGTYVLLELPDVARNRVMGSDTVGTLLFGASVVGAVLLMHRLASVAAGETERSNLISSMALLVLIVVAMVGTRERVRHPRFVVRASQLTEPALRYAEARDSATVATQLP